MKTHLLLGKRITAVHLATDRKAIKFDIADGNPIIANAYGDCCSESWIESLDNPDALLGTVQEATDANGLEAGPEDKNDEYECISYYGFKIATEKGHCTIDYRNSSNGCYGGWLAWPSDDHSWHYTGVFNQNESAMDWEKIA